MVLIFSLVVAGKMTGTLERIKALPLNSASGHHHLHHHAGTGKMPFHL
jgi:hypothetical protein